MLHTLPKITTKKKKRVGRGHGSGRVKTAGRGTKGQNARSQRPLRFEGGALPLTKRLPFLRGKGRNKAKAKELVVNLSVLNRLPKDATVNIENLAKYHIVRLKEAVEFGVKILGDGEITIPLTVTLPTSKSAKQKIEKSGGKVNN